MHLLSVVAYLGPVEATGFTIKTRSRKEVVLYIGDNGSKVCYSLFEGEKPIISTTSPEEVTKEIEKLL